MPLTNEPNREWDAWLVDGLGGREEAFQAALVAALQARNIPKAKVGYGVLNMWWRKDSRYVDVVTELDGTIGTTIHMQEYGTGLFVGRAVGLYSGTNYYKRMAASAFLETVDRCIRDTILTLATAESIHPVADIARKEVLAKR